MIAWEPEPDPETAPVGSDDDPGVTRYHLLATTAAPESARDLVRRWCTDRAVPGQAADRVVLLAQAATRVALELAPRRVAVGLRWLDADRVVVDVSSRDCSAPQAAARREGGRRHPTTTVFDVASDSWGLRLRAREAVHWFVVDTRPVT